MTDHKPLSPQFDTLDHLTEQLPDCTLTAPEAVKMASKWWDAIGRKLISKTFNRSRIDTAKGPGANGAPAIFVKGTGEVEIPSQILEGVEWARLGKREMGLVVKCWLSQYRAVYAPGKVALPDRVVRRSRL